MSVNAAHRGELIAGPGIGFGHVGRAGEARADAVGERGGIFHDVRALQALFADALIHGEVELFDGGLRGLPGIDSRSRGCSGRGLVFISGEEGQRGDEEQSGQTARASAAARAVCIGWCLREE